MRRPKKFLNSVGRGILSQSRMIKNFPGDLTRDPSITISAVTLEKISSNDYLKNLYAEEQFLLQKIIAKDVVD